MAEAAPEAAAFGLWVEQLVAESTGKQGKGIVPVRGGGERFEPRLEDDGEVSVDMGAPRFAPDDVPFLGGAGAATREVHGHRRVGHGGLRRRYR